MSSNTSNDPSKNTANDYARWLRGSHLNMTWREVCNKAADKLDELAEYEKLEETKL